MTSRRAGLFSSANPASHLDAGTAETPRRISRFPAMLRSGRLIPAWAFLTTVLFILFMVTISLHMRGRAWTSRISRSLSVGANHGEAVLLDAAADEAADSKRPLLWQTATTLVVVAGHAIFTGNRAEPAEIRDERNWYLEPSQVGLVDTFINHIRRGVELAEEDPSSLLMFSGGVTRPGVGPRSEGSSYWLVADALHWFGKRDVMNRTHVEEFARDSHENLLFSVCRFRQLTGRYPHEIKVVSFSFKEERFTSVHRRALRFPIKRFHYYGVDPDGAGGLRSRLGAWERAKTLAPFYKDFYGCNDPALYQKRIDRNPFIRYHPYPQGCPELSQLFKYCGREVFSGPLPWDPRIGAQSPSLQEGAKIGDSSVT